MVSDSDPIHALEAELAFTRVEDVLVDATGRGPRRARTLGAEESRDPGAYDRRICRAWDCSALDGFQPDIREHGFARASRRSSACTSSRAAPTRCER